jgi:hypothetical protein
VNESPGLDVVPQTIKFTRKRYQKMCGGRVRSEPLGKHSDLQTPSSFKMETTRSEGPGKGNKRPETGQRGGTGKGE